MDGGGTLEGKGVSTRQMPGHELPPDETDAALVARAASGDRQALAGLYLRHQAAMYRFGLHMTGSAAAAEDIVQEVFVRLMRNFDRYRSEHPLPAYLYGIARNVARRRLQRERRLVPLDHAAQETVPAQGTEQLERREHLCLLRQAIVMLPAAHREVIVMCDLHKLSYELAAAAIGCPVGTVRSRLHRARAALAERMQRAPGNNQGAPRMERCPV